MKKIIKKLSIFLLILIFLLASCTGKSEDGLGELKRGEDKPQNSETLEDKESEKDKISNKQDSKYSRQEDDSYIYLDELDLAGDGYYYTLEEVASYLWTRGYLPSNFIKKKEAYSLGWDPKEGNLWDVSDKAVIGGDRFGNREGLLPKARARTYYEADIDYNGGRRNAKRLVYSDDGLMFYTDDHYNTFKEVKIKDEKS